jgi:branched-chain amino acid transport system permease protein
MPPLMRSGWKLGLTGLIALLVLPALVPGQYAMQLVNLGLISLIAVVCLNFITGHCGQINFAQAAFWGIGAYATALLTLKGVSFWFALPLAAAATGLCSLLLGVPTLRLRAFYLAMATIAFGEIVQRVLVHWESVTGGTSGLRNVPGIPLFGHQLTGHREPYYFLLAWVALALCLSLRIRASKIGRAMIALRDSEIAAEVMGVDTVRTKMLAFTLSSVYAGVAGSLYVSSMHLCGVAFCLLLKFALARMRFCRMSRAHLVQMNGLGLVLWWAMYSPIAVSSSTTLVNTPRRIRSVVMSRKNLSTLFSQDAEVGVKCM